MTAPRSPRMLLDIDGRAVCAHLRLDDDAASATPIVLAAGGAGQGTDGAWGPSLEDLLARIGPVVTYDRAGSGRSDGPPHGTVADAADELDRVLDALEVRRPALLVGWSLGAFVAEALLVRRPARVAGLVLVDPTPTEPPPSSLLVRTQLAVTRPLIQLAGLASRAGVFSGGLGERVAALMGSADGTPDAAALALRVLRDPDALAGQAAMMRLVPGYASELEDTLAGVSLPDVPAVVVTAGRRGGVPPEYVENVAASHARLTARFPRGRLVTAENSGHGIPYDAPDTVADAVRSVLAAT